ncbi:MAG: hypothetical protein Q9192_001273 [Flavoplaca navasiana]
MTQDYSRTARARQDQFVSQLRGHLARTAVTSEAPQPTFTMEDVTAVAWGILEKDADAVAQEGEEEDGILRVQEL